MPRDAFEPLIPKYGPALALYCLHMCGEDRDAQRRMALHLVLALRKEAPPPAHAANRREARGMRSEPSTIRGRL